MDELNLFKKQISKLDNSIKIVSDDKLFRKGDVKVDFAFYSKKMFVNVFVISNDSNLTISKSRNLVSLINYLLKKKVYVIFLYSINNEDTLIFVSENLRIINPFFLSTSYFIKKDIPIIEFIEGNLSFDIVINSIFNNDIFYYGPKIGYNRVGIELIKDECWKCKKEIFSVTGIVIPNKKVNDWKTENWNYFHSNLNLSQLNPNLVKQISEKVEYYRKNFKNNVTPIKNNYSKTMRLMYPSATCPFCGSMRGEFFLNEERIDLLHNWKKNIEHNKIKYIGLDCELKQEDLNKLSYSFIGNTELIGWYFKDNILKYCV